MRQEVARAHKGWALDAVILHNDVLKLMKEEVRGPPSVNLFPLISVFYIFKILI